MINVAMLTPFFTQKLGGPYNVITEISPFLAKAGFTTKVFTSSAVSQQSNLRTKFFEQRNKNFLIYRFDSFLKLKEYRISLSLIPFLIKNLRDIDIIHSHALRSYQEDIGFISNISSKKPYIISAHGGISINWDYGDKIPKMLHDKTIGYLKKKLINPHFIAVTKYEIPIIRKYGIEESHIHYIPNGVNVDLFKPMNSDELKRFYGLEDHNLVLYVGRIAKGKGLDTLLKAMKNVVEKNKKVKLMIIGGDSGYLAQMNELISLYNLAKSVIYIGFIPKHKLPAYYSMADLVIYPSRQEIFGLVLVEAMACGKAVIGSNILGPREIIEHGITGYTSDFKDAGELSSTIIKLMNNQDQLLEMGKKGLERVRKYYSWKNTARLHIKLYKSLLKNKV
jgi:glycosyltransferase involved in cell wall biosynthesis